MFEDRVAAGRSLARALKKFEGENPVVLGIPRGGIIVAAEVAREMNTGLDVIIPRKIGAPENPELAIGAVAGDGQVIMNRELVKSLNVSEDYINKNIDKELQEIKRRRRQYMGELSGLNVGNKVVLIIDDGLATGFTARAAVKALRTLKPRKIILAVPVAPAETVAKLAPEVDELVNLSTPPEFYAVGQFYKEFRQVTDDEVKETMRQLRVA